MVLKCIGFFLLFKSFNVLAQTHNYGEVPLEEKIIPDFNFSRVIYNKKHKIYRSQALGAKGLDFVYKKLSSLNYQTPKVVLYIGRHGYSVRHKMKKSIKYLKFVEDEEQYLSNMNLLFLHPFFTNLYISGDNPQLDTKEYNIDHFSKNQVISSSLESFISILNFVLMSQKTILFHCTGGRHRSGMISLAIRYMQGGEWTKSLDNPLFAEDIDTKESIVCNNLAEVEYLYYSDGEPRKKNLDFIKWFVTTVFFKDFKDKFQRSLNEGL